MSFFQRGALFAAGVHALQYLTGQFQMIAQYGQLVVLLVEVEIESQHEEADVLSVACPLERSHLFLKSGQLDAAADGTSGINGLLRFECKVVAEVRHPDLGAVAEVAVPQMSVAPIAGRGRHTDVGQALCLGRFQGLFGRGFLSTPGLQADTVLVGQREELVDAHYTRLGV